MLTAEQVARFRADGFIKSGRVLDDQTLEGLRSELVRVMEQQNDPTVKQPVNIANYSQNKDAPIWQIIGICEASEPYRQLLYNKQICEEVAQVTGAEQLRVWHDQIQYKPVKGAVNMWHQDSHYWPNIMPKTTQVSAWVALDDADETNGCMSMIPGSHLWKTQIFELGLLGSFDALPKVIDGHGVEIRLCPVKKGEVHYHHALTWHGSQANLSNQPRRAIAIHYMTQDTLFDGNYHAAGKRNAISPFMGHLKHGQRMEGEHFPLTWERAPVAVTAAR